MLRWLRRMLLRPSPDRTSRRAELDRLIVWSDRILRQSRTTIERVEPSIRKADRAEQLASYSRVRVGR